MKFSPNNKYINENHLQRQSLWKEPLIRNSLPNKMMENLKGTNLELPMCLLDWINKDNLNWFHLSSNPNAIGLLKENPDEINWNYLSLNPNAIALLRENPYKIKWNCLSKNSSLDAIALLRENPYKINWNCLSKNSSLDAIALLKENPDK